MKSETNGNSKKGRTLPILGFLAWQIANPLSQASAQDSQWWDSVA